METVFVRCESWYSGYFEPSWQYSGTNGWLRRPPHKCTDVILYWSVERMPHCPPLPQTLHTPAGAETSLVQKEGMRSLQVNFKHFPPSADNTNNVNAPRTPAKTSGHNSVFPRCAGGFRLPSSAAPTPGSLGPLQQVGRHTALSGLQVSWPPSC